MHMKTNQHGLPEMFRPLLWSFKWEDIDLKKHKEDIILNTVNHGSLKHWRWIMNYYSKDEIRHILENRIATEIYPESQNLARLIFDVRNFRHAR